MFYVSIFAHRLCLSSVCKNSDIFPFTLVQLREELCLKLETYNRSRNRDDIDIFWDEHFTKTGSGTNTINTEPSQVVLSDVVPIRQSYGYGLAGIPA